MNTQPTPELTRTDWLEIWWALMVIPNQYNAEARRKVEKYLDDRPMNLSDKVKKGRQA